MESIVLLIEGGYMEEKIKYDELTEPGGVILLKYVRGEASAEERRLVEDWLKENNEHEKELLQIARIYFAQRTQKRLADRDPLKAFNQIQSKLKKRSFNLYFRRIVAVAACFIGAFLLSVTLVDMKNFKALRLIKPQSVTVQANAGMRTNLELPDGTVVCLNSGSSITYPLPYDKDQRKVSLVGEAYFKVTHNPECPFIVGVIDDKMSVKVLGTEFNLQAYAGENKICATLVNGRIDLEIKTAKGQLSRALLPSERASYDLLSNTLNVETVNTMYDTGWMEGKLMFKDSPLPEVLKRLSYFYNVDFEVKDAIIKSYCFTGTFVNRQLPQILDYLKISSNIDYKINHVLTDDSEKITKTKVILWNKK